jgi:hypothetical protein
MISRENLKMQYVDNLDQTGLISDKVFVLGQPLFRLQMNSSIFFFYKQLCINKSVRFDSRISREKIIFP